MILLFSSSNTTMVIRQSSNQHPMYHVTLVVKKGRVLCSVTTPNCDIEPGHALTLMPYILPEMGQMST